MFSLILFSLILVIVKQLISLFALEVGKIATNV